MDFRTGANEVLASVVVFLVALPLCMGIAVASGVPPAMGIVSGIIGGILVGYFSGSPLQVSGPAAGLAVIVFEAVHTYGLGPLGPMLVVAGLIQVVAGRMHLGQWFRAVAPAVIHAMLAGIGVLIFASQFHVMVDDTPNSNGIVNVVTIPQAVLKGITPVEGTPHHLAAGIGVLSLVILVGWNFIRERSGSSILRTLPAPLMAVGAAVAAAIAFDLPIAYVEVPDGIGGLVRLPTLDDVAVLATPGGMGTSLAIAVIASAEALLCAVAVDKLHDGRRSDLDQELFAQGLGNTVSGFVGGLPITGVIVRSTANLESGAKTRWSAIIHGVWLLIAVAAVPFLLEHIPVSALAAVLVYIGWRLVKLEVPRELWKRDRGDFAIYMITIVAIVAFNLLEGLMIGFMLSLLKLAWSFSTLDVDVVDRDGDPETVDLTLVGSGTFVGLPNLARALDTVPEGREVHVHLDHVDYVDHACFELLSDWRNQYEGRGGKVVLEWDTLASRATYRQSSSGSSAA